MNKLVKRKIKEDIRKNEEIIIANILENVATKNINSALRIQSNLLPKIKKNNGMVTHNREEILARQIIIESYTKIRGKF